MRRHVHADELLKLGFPEKAIQEAVEAEKLGLFNIEPAPDLVDRTVESCRSIVPKREGVLRRIIRKLFAR